jgi:hypothetical protein
MDMNGKQMSGRKMTDANMTGNAMRAQVSPPRAAQVEPAGLGRKRFPIGWLLPVAALSFFLGHFWSYIPVVRGIVWLFLLSKILTGTAPGAFLL